MQLGQRAPKRINQGGDALVGSWASGSVGCCWGVFVILVYFSDVLAKMALVASNLQK